MRSRIGAMVERMEAIARPLSDPSEQVEDRGNHRGLDPELLRVPHRTN